jgi:hypothetical protein
MKEKKKNRGALVLRYIISEDVFGKPSLTIDLMFIK